MTPAAPPPSGRVAGIDYGRRRIGIAVCDAERGGAGRAAGHAQHAVAAGDPASCHAFAEIPAADDES